MQEDTIKTVKESSKAHPKYTLACGKLVKGVTTILAILAKPLLVKWANNLGLEGVDSNVYTRKIARIGTLAHDMVISHLENKKVDTSSYSEEEINASLVCFNNFLLWKKGKKITLLLLEQSLVSEKYEYGGKIDIYCKLDGVKTLIDLKTSSSIYPEMFHQLAAYKNLLEENGYIVEQVRLVRIGKKEGDVIDVPLSNTNIHWEIFKLCLELYNLRKEVF